MTSLSLHFYILTPIHLKTPVKAHIHSLYQSCTHKLLTTANKTFPHNVCLKFSTNPSSLFTVRLKASVCVSSEEPLSLCCYFLHCTLSRWGGWGEWGCRGWTQDRDRRRDRIKGRRLNWSWGSHVCLSGGSGGEVVTCSDRLRRSGSEQEGALVLRQHCKQTGGRGVRPAPWLIMTIQNPANVVIYYNIRHTCGLTSYICDYCLLFKCIPAVHTDGWHEQTLAKTFASPQTCSNKATNGRNKKTTTQTGAKFTDFWLQRVWNVFWVPFFYQVITGHLLPSAAGLLSFLKITLIWSAL